LINSLTHDKVVFLLFFHQLASIAELNLDSGVVLDVIFDLGQGVLGELVSQNDKLDQTWEFLQVWFLYVLDLVSVSVDEHQAFEVVWAFDELAPQCVIHVARAQVQPSDMVPRVR
jgi:hypothetical protein